MSCQFDTMANLRLTAWNGSTWKDLGNGGTVGTTNTGTIKTTGNSSIYGYYTLATTDTFRCVKCEADAGEDKVALQLEQILIGSIDNNAVSILWTPENRLLEFRKSQVLYSPLYKEVMKKQVTNSTGCIAEDTMEIQVNLNPDYSHFNLRCPTHE
jgi:hypothetical protein